MDIVVDLVAVGIGYDAEVRKFAGFEIACAEEPVEIDILFFESVADFFGA